MKKLLIYLLTFVIIMCAVSFPVYATTAVTDYSNLEPDENGRYWIYFHFESDAFTYANSTISHSADLDFYVDVTNFYLTYGHAGFSFNEIANSDRISTFFQIPYGGYTSTPINYVVSGTYDGVEYSFSKTNGQFYYFDFEYILGINSSTTYGLSKNYYDCFTYLPKSNLSQYDFAWYPYIQNKPIIKVANPQEPVFEFSYFETTNTKTTTGIDVVLRYPYETATDYYNKTNKLVEVPLMSQPATALCNTIIDVRMTVLLDGKTITTSWVPLGSIGYARESLWLQEIVYMMYPDDYVDGKLDQAYSNNYDCSTWFESWAFGNAWSGQDGMNYLHFDLSNLPEFLANCGVSVGDDDVTLLQLEVSAQNYHTGVNKFSDVVYSSYDVNTNTTITDIYEPDSGHKITVDDNGNPVFIIVDLTINPTPSNPVINTPDNPGTIPSVNPGGAVVDPNNSILDAIIAFVNFFIEIIAAILQGILKIFRTIFSLIGDIIAMAGEVPKVFSFIFGALPSEFGVLFTLGLSLAIYGMFFRR